MMLALERKDERPNPFGPPGGAIHDDAPVTPPGTKVAVAYLALSSPGSIIIARPLKELFAHVRNLNLPSLQLIVRSIIVLALGIFRGHLCDRVMLAAGKGEEEGVLHSLNGRATKSSYEQLQREYPYMLERAYLLTYNNKSYDAAQDKPVGKKEHSYHDRQANFDLFIRFPNYANYTEITPQAIFDLYRNFYGINITQKLSHNTISDLFKSVCFTLGHIVR